jgi:hypothetical protein
MFWIYIIIMLLGGAYGIFKGIKSWHKSSSKFKSLFFIILGSIAVLVGIFIIFAIVRLGSNGGLFVGFL